MISRFSLSDLNAMRPSVAVEESLQALGYNLKVARLKRRLPQSVLSDRAGVGISTLVKIEKGDCGVAIGAYASVIQALGLGAPLGEIALADPLGQALEAQTLPKRIRASKKFSSEAKSPMIVDPVDDGN